MIETEQPELDLDLTVSGVLEEIVHDVGAEVPVGTAIAYIETEAGG